MLGGILIASPAGRSWRAAPDEGISLLQHSNTAILHSHSQLSKRNESKGTALARRPTQLSSGQQMQVNMKHRLTAIGIAIEHQAITFFGNALLPCIITRRQY